MSIFSKLFGKKEGTNPKNNVEDFASLTRVYFQSALAANLGISNIRMMPDLAQFKRLFKVPTQNGRLGLGEKTVAKKMLMADYGLSDNFFKEIDSSIKKHCRTQNEIQPYMFLYQGFLNDLMMMMSTLMQWKIRIPSIFKSVIKSEVEKSVHKICTKTVWSKDDEHKTAANIRMYKERLGYSEQWMSEYVYNVLMLAKKAPKPKDTEKK
ncbi:MAG: hypothetical protein Q4D30_07015 [Bacteroidales bacterium]|nr:hypothetical protein [Bacteroidaceae bacterium]MDO4186219.1 hypothetical protein [Bacteroidales bacterium]MBQ9884071.1 hypothetical protein [Bacteroidaceae bacterium]MBR2160907.1 hypothetical protein [Bacteroidaceae bacterium]MBR3013954.1 hypothetical protein [Bacteroidaceae bacterium]